MTSTELYHKYRGKCREMSEAAINADPTLTLVRGHYECPFWGKQQHWWTVRADGTIFDPTVLQFPSAGSGKYIPFDGVVPCSQCGKKMKEEDAEFDGNYAFCSNMCHGIYIGVYDA